MLKAPAHKKYWNFNAFLHNSYSSKIWRWDYRREKMQNKQYTKPFFWLLVISSSSLMKRNPLCFAEVDCSSHWDQKIFWKTTLIQLNVVKISSLQLNQFCQEDQIQLFFVIENVRCFYLRLHWFSAWFEYQWNKTNVCGDEIWTNWIGYLEKIT